VPPANTSTLPEDRFAPTMPAAVGSEETRLSQETTVPMEVQRSAAVISQFSVLNGPEQGKQFMVDRFPAEIGRELTATIRLDQDTSISRKHALLYQVAGSLHVRDLNSRHGTRVNGRTVADQVLQPGDSIEIGGTRLQYQRIER
jgi:pSer/pThr/pTyr-binding forkhead associated (FHA) protein